jgi:tRNA(Ile)-lysidine synthase TilS/MesJ
MSMPGKYDLLKQFKQFNQDHALFSPKQKTGLALSGGVDSVVLLHLFTLIREELDLQLVACNLNHPS